MVVAYFFELALSKTDRRLVNQRRTTVLQITAFKFNIFYQYTPASLVNIFDNFIGSNIRLQFFRLSLQRT